MVFEPTSFQTAMLLGASLAHGQRKNRPASSGLAAVLLEATSVPSGLAAVFLEATSVLDRPSLVRFTAHARQVSAVVKVYST